MATRNENKNQRTVNAVSAYDLHETQADLASMIFRAAARMVGPDGYHLTDSAWELIGTAQALHALAHDVVLD